MARIFGFDFGINFDRPYFSRSFSEFWSRWHISLSSWLRDYLYIPLGGNRGGTLKTIRNLMLTMLLGGLWHGASWTFVVWGALHGTYLVLQRFIAPLYQRVIRALRVPASASNAFLVLLVFHLTCFGWIFFRASSFANAWQVLSGIASFHGAHLADIDNRGRILKCIVMIAVLLIFEAGAFLPKRREEVGASSPGLRLAFIAACIWVVLIFGSFSGSNFIYFQF